MAPMISKKSLLSPISIKKNRVSFLALFFIF